MTIDVYTLTLINEDFIDVQDSFDTEDESITLQTENNVEVVSVEENA